MVSRPAAPVIVAREPRECDAVPPPANRSRAEERAADFAAQLTAEGWDPAAAEARALAAYGLRKRAFVARLPSLSREFRRALCAEVATARPGAEGPTVISLATR